MPPLKKPRWETFILAYLQGKSATESATIAGYSQKTAHVQGCVLLKNPNIKARLKELQEKTARAKIMSVSERMERLTEIAKGRYPDYVECGADGSWISIGPESPNPGAVAEVHSRTEYDKNGSKPTVITAVKLHDPVKAIAELNKMEGAYAPQKINVTGEGLLPPVHVTVISPEARTLVQQIMEGPTHLIEAPRQLEVESST